MKIAQLFMTIAPLLTLKILTKEIGVRQDLGNKTSLVNWAPMTMALTFEERKKKEENL